MDRHVEVAIEFASALVDAAFGRARDLLAPKLRDELTPGALSDQFYAMFRGYADGEPKNILCNEDCATTSWPGKLADDIGSVYVGIEGDDFLEGIDVIVTNVEGDAFIRNIMWGRP